MRLDICRSHTFAFLPESEVIDLTSTTTDREIFFDTEEHSTPYDDGDMDMADVCGVTIWTCQDPSADRTVNFMPEGEVPGPLCP